MVQSLAWLSQDRLLRDGDEEGHVGAAELFLHKALEGDLLGFLDMAWRGSLGEYPPLFPAVVGGAWALLGGGDPGALPLRAVGLLWLLVAALCMGALARSLVAARGWSAHDPVPPGDLAAALGHSLTLALPLAGALGRHFMPEGFLVGMVALAAWTAGWAAAAPGLGRALVLGGVLGLGLLSKQTFVLYAAVPVVLLALPRLRLWAAVSALGALAVAGPWYLGQLTAQLGYVASSVGAGAAVSAGAQALYYPALLPWSLAGPVLVFAALVSVLVLVRLGPDDGRRGLLVGLLWLLLTVGLLAVIPKKYPRLGAPLGLPVVLVVALGLPRTRRRGLAGLVVTAGALAWAVGLSWGGRQTPPWAPVVDPRCEQRWLRPPSPDDLGMAAVVAAVRGAPPGVVAVAGEAEVPCAVQTTHPWTTHLGPALRRAGLEREVVTGRRRDAAVQLVFGGTGPTALALPALGTTLRIDVAGAR